VQEDDDRPSRHDGVVLSPEEYGWLVLDRRRGRHHRLNPTAGVILSLCDGTRTLDELVADVSDHYGLEPGEAATQIRPLLVEVEALGLLMSDDAAPAVERYRSPRPLGWDHTGGTYSALDLHFDVRCTDLTVLETIERSLHTLRAGPDTQPATHLDVWSHNAGWSGQLGSRTFGPGLPAEYVAEQVIGLVNQSVVARNRRRWLVHASGIEHEGRCVLVMGPTNSGKSTIAAAAVAAGFGYLGDEVIGVDPITRQVEGYPKPITINPGSKVVIGAGDADLGISWRNWYLDPELLHAGSIRRTASLRAVLIARHSPGAPIGPTPCDTSDAVEAWMANSFNVARHAAHVDNIEAMTRSVGFYRYEHDDVAATVDTLAALLGRI